MSFFIPPQGDLDVDSDTPGTSTGHRVRGPQSSKVLQSSLDFIINRNYFDGRNFSPDRQLIRIPSAAWFWN